MQLINDPDFLLFIILVTTETLTILGMAYGFGAKIPNAKKVTV